jgi:hypothetical protein
VYSDTPIWYFFNGETNGSLYSKRKKAPLFEEAPLNLQWSPVPCPPEGSAYKYLWRMNDKERSTLLLARILSKGT